MKLPRIASFHTSAALALTCVLATINFATAEASPSPTVTITVDASKPGRTIATDFVGLSFEANMMHETWIDPAVSNVDELIGNLGDGNLRFSANQVDRTAWMPDPSLTPPAWANGQIITPADLSRVGELAQATGWSVDMGVNLGQFNPAAAADQTREAQRRIGSSLRSVQIGNEPNFYILAPVLQAGNRKPYIPLTYIADVKKYRTAIRAAAPGVAIEGPDSVNGAVGHPIGDPLLGLVLAQPWLPPYIQAFGKESTSLNQHYYPFINTARIGIPDEISPLIGGPPSIAKLMSRDAATKQVTFFRQFVSQAESAGLKARLTETNSVAKEGKEGVTNSFGAALWTVDYLLTAAREGIASVNLHVQALDCQSYSVICFADETARQAGTARVNPNYYGLRMVSELAGGQMLPVTVDSAANVRAYAARMPNGEIKVVVANLDTGFTGDADVKIVGTTTTTASAISLTGASPEALTGAKLAGSTVTADGHFSPGPATPISSYPTGYRVTLSQPMATLLTAR